MTGDAFIRFRQVDFRYTLRDREAPFILKEFDLAIAQGEFYMLLGPSGCGKTTALNLLAGFDHPTAGETLVDGAPVAGPAVERVVIFQGDDSLYPWLTAEENIAFALKIAGVGAAERRRKAQEYLQMVGLEGQGHKFPGQLSGGMKQRIQIARALVSESRILLMDEPFAALDAQTRTILQDELASIQRRTHRTVLFITHDIAESILLADRIGVMRAGPASAIKEEIVVDLPRPRRRGAPEFGALYDRIQSILSEEVNKVLRTERTS